MVSEQWDIVQLSSNGAVVIMSLCLAFCRCRGEQCQDAGWWSPEENFQSSGE